MIFKYSIVIIIVLGSCIRSNDLKISNDRFRVPVVLNSNLAVSDRAKIETNHKIGYSEIPIMGKFSFLDTIDIAFNDPNFEGWDNPDYKNRFGDVIYDYASWHENDSLDVNGLELYFDYKQTIYLIDSDSIARPYYPIFLVNSTSSSKVFTGWDRNAKGAQEAFSTEHDEWLSLDTVERSLFGCGNGYMITIVKPREFLLLLMKKYKGDYRPQMRLNIKNAESSIVSKQFIGDITEEQYNWLNLPKE